MLRLRSQAIRRLRTTSSCSSCLATSRTPAAIGLQSGVAARRRIDDHFSRTVHTSPIRLSDDKKDKILPPEASSDGPAAIEVQEALEKTLSKRSIRRIKNRENANKPVKKGKKMTEDGEMASENTKQQLIVLQGALAALKNVLDQQKINNIKQSEKKKKTKKKKKGKDSQTEQPEAPILEKRSKFPKQKQTAKPPVQEIKPKPKPDPESEPPPPEPQGSATFQMRKARKVPVGRKTASPAEVTPRHKRESKDLEANKHELRRLKIELKKHAKSASKIEDPKISTDIKPAGNTESKLEIFAKSAAIGAALGKSPTEKHMIKKQREKRPDKKSKSKPTPNNIMPPEEVDMNRKSPLQISVLSPEELELVPIEKPQPPVATLAHGLERTLFNPGVYHLQDPRSKVYNFDPYLANIMPIQEFDFDALQQYVTSSKDTALIDVARENGKKYTGSTSSMTSMLSHFHYLLSAWRQINSSMMTKEFEVPSQQFTRLMRAPAAVFLHWKDGVYAIDADKEFDSASILSMLGKSMEKLLTLPVDEYERYRRGKSHQISEEERNAPEAYHYTGLGDFMMRSQLDAHDPRVPGTGMFDIKTRAVVTIRMDSKGFTKGLGYELRHRYGNWESFEREYHDMIRAAFLKYSLQVRMGRMDGIFVAFHNTERIFGFQYIPLEEMDLSLHGTSDLTIGDREFKLSLALLNELLDRASKKFPEKSLRLFVETRTSVNTPFMYAFVKPVEPGEIEAVQNAGKESVAEFEREILGLQSAIKSGSSLEAEDEGQEKIAEDGEGTDVSEIPEESDIQEDDNATESWDEIQAMVEDAMEDEELGVDAVRQAIEDALTESGLLEEQTPEEARGYVDALLSALTDGSGDSSAISSEVDERTEVDTDSDTLTVQSSDVDDTNSETELEKTDQISSDQSYQPAGSDDGYIPGGAPDANRYQDMSTALPQADVAEKEHVQDEERADEESDLEEDDSQQDSSSPNMTSLSNMIVRMTRRLDENGVAEQQAAVSSKLQEFERILGKMISESREDEQDATDSGVLSRDSKVESGAQEAEGSSTETLHSDGGDIDAPTASGVITDAEFKSDAILGMVLTVRNKVNDKFVTRPENLTQEDTWEVEYNIEELPDERAARLFEMCRKRRQTAYGKGSRGRSNSWHEMFEGALPQYVAAGRKFRSKENKEAKEQPVYILGEDTPKTYEQVFGEKKEG